MYVKEFHTYVLSFLREHLWIQKIGETIEYGILYIFNFFIYTCWIVYLKINSKQI